MSVTARRADSVSTLTVLDVALLLNARPTDLVNTLSSAGYAVDRLLHPLSFIQAEVILQRFEAGILVRPRCRDHLGAAIPENQNRALRAQQARTAELKAARTASRKRKSRAPREERQRAEEQRARDQARAAALRQRSPVWEESYADRKTSSPSPRPAAGYRAPKDGITRALAAGAPGLGRRS